MMVSLGSLPLLHLLLLFFFFLSQPAIPPASGYLSVGSYGHECIGHCAAYREDYTWCKTDDWKSGGWDYCSVIDGVTADGDNCRDDCRHRGKKLSRNITGEAPKSSLTLPTQPGIPQPIFSLLYYRCTKLAIAILVG